MKLSMLSAVVLAGLAISASAESALAANDPGHVVALSGGMPGKVSAGTRIVRVTATDVAFDLKRLDVQAGETVRFIVTNKGQIDHEFVVASASEHAAHEQEMASMDPAMVMPDDANAVTLKPGQTKELVWTFAAAANIQFSCDYPGHAEQGMKGEIAIKG